MTSGLVDYSGELDPDLSIGDFSKDVLVELLKLYSRLFLAIDGFWYLAVRQRTGDDEALACDMWAWEKEVRYEMRRLAKLLRIEGSDVTTLMKALQMTPWFQNVTYRIQTAGRSRALLTITDCPVLEALEREGEGREKTICRVMDTLVFKKYAEFFNPDIEVRHLKLPPRESQQDICCQWEFRLP